MSPSVHRANIRNPQVRRGAPKQVQASGSPNVPSGTPNSQMKLQSPVNPTRKVNVQVDEHPGVQWGGFVSNLTPRVQTPQRQHKPVSVGIAPDLNRTAMRYTSTPNARDMKGWNPGSNLSVNPVLPRNRDRNNSIGFTPFAGVNNVPSGTRQVRHPDGRVQGQHGGTGVS